MRNAKYWLRCSFVLAVFVLSFGLAGAAGGLDILSPGYALENRLTAIRNAPDAPYKHADLVRLAEILRAAGRMQDAMATYSNALLICTDAYAYFQYADLLAGASNYKSAVRAYDCAAILATTNRDIIHYNRACAASLGRDAVTAVSALDRALYYGYTNIPWILRDPDMQWLLAGTNALASGISNRLVRLQSARTETNWTPYDLSALTGTWIAADWLRAMQHGAGALAATNRGQLTISRTGSGFTLLYTTDFHQALCQGTIHAASNGRASGFVRIQAETGSLLLDAVKATRDSLRLWNVLHAVDFVRVDCGASAAAFDSEAYLWNLVLAGDYVDPDGHAWHFDSEGSVRIDAGTAQRYRLRLDPYGPPAGDAFFAVNDKQTVEYAGHALAWCGYRKTACGMDLHLYDRSPDGLYVAAGVVRLRRSVD